MPIFPKISCNFVAIYPLFAMEPKSRNAHKKWVLSFQKQLSAIPQINPLMVICGYLFIIALFYIYVVIFIKILKQRVLYFQNPRVASSRSWVFLISLVYVCMYLLRWKYCAWMNASQATENIFQSATTASWFWYVFWKFIGLSWLGVGGESLAFDPCLVACVLWHQH